MKRWCRLAFSAACLLFAGALSAQTPRFGVELEVGPAWQSYNDVEIPNDGSATRFSLKELIGTGPWPAGRVYVTWQLNERHALRLLAAPLSITENAVPAREIRFAGGTFAAGEATRATYAFNSYRVSWRYRVHAGARSRAWIGVTAKLRVAEIAVQQGTVESSKDDVGFVPLLHVAGEWDMAPRLHVGLDADALAGGPGRAIDAALKLGYDVGDVWRLQAGYRIVEGGADVDAVYTFAGFHYAVVSLAWRR